MSHLPQYTGAIEGTSRWSRCQGGRNRSRGTAGAELGSLHVLFIRHFPANKTHAWAAINTHDTTRITSPFCQISSTAALHYQPQHNPPYTSLTMAIGIFTILAGLVALAAGYFYFFGISPETKRKMEQQALKTMGENKMSYMAKGKSSHPLDAYPALHTPLFAQLVLSTSTNTAQTRSTRSPHRTKKTSRTSSRASRTLPAAPCRTPLESKLVKPQTGSQVL
jgi:hypothetical protein